MNEAAKAADYVATAGTRPVYEQPLNERMRTFLRLEFLFRQMLFQAEHDSSWSSRNAVGSLLDVFSILSRGDVRGEVLKELERQLFMLERLQQAEDVDNARLTGVTRNLRALRAALSAVGPKYLQPLRDNQFLNAIKHRSSIPGGTCAFDIPEYTHWLRQDYARRATDTAAWIEVVRPLCEAVMGLLWLVRNSRQPTTQNAVGGVYQHSMGRETIHGLIRIELPGDADLFPEVSGGQHRFSVRLMEWQPGEPRPEQTDRDVSFQLTVC
jgi:cell division protein ZapD